MDWSKFPDFVAFSLLIVAFASVASHGRTHAAYVWLVGWLMIVLHFAACLFASVSGIWGSVAQFAVLASLALAAELFMWVVVPYRNQPSSKSLVAVLAGTYILYLGLLIGFPDSIRTQQIAAVLIGALPLVLAASLRKRFNHPLRWIRVIGALALSIVLLLVSGRGFTGNVLALNAVLFAVYLGCAIHFWYAYRRPTAGALITIAGFFAWSSVFAIGPYMQLAFPLVHLESELWNLPKFLVAVGMILLVLEEQIEHNKYLALHDELTGLPNRRLFQDRLVGALERAQRAGTQTALLLIDLDHFKEVNDTVGHHVGDELLKCASELFRQRMRRSDTVARTGGDEFSVILESPTSREDAVRVGQVLTQLLESPLRIQGHTLHIGASIGVAIYPDDAHDAESLCIAADLKMYAQKRNSGKKQRDHVSIAFAPNHPAQDQS